MSGETPRVERIDEPDITLASVRNGFDRGVGDHVSLAFRLYRNNFLAWAQLLLWPTVFVIAGRLTWQIALQLPGEARIIGTILGFIIAVAAKWELMLRLLAIVGRVATGSRSLKEALIQARKKQGALLSTILFAGTLAAVATVLWLLEISCAAILFKISPIIAAAGAFLGVTGASLTVFFIYSSLFMALTGMVIQERAVWTAVSSDFSLASRHFFRSLFCGFMVLVSVTAISVPLWLMPAVFLIVDAIRLGPEVYNGSTQPFYSQVLVVFWESLVELVTWPLVFLAYGLYYLDLRRLEEGTDITSSIEELCGERKPNRGFGQSATGEM